MSKWVVFIADPSTLPPETGGNFFAVLIILACQFIIIAGPILIYAEHGRNGKYFPKWVLPFAFILALAVDIGVATVVAQQPGVNTAYRVMAVSLFFLVVTLLIRKYVSRMEPTS